MSLDLATISHIICSKYEFRNRSVGTLTKTYCTPINKKPSINVGNACNIWYCTAEAFEGIQFKYPCLQQLFSFYVPLH